MPEPRLLYLRILRVPPLPEVVLGIQSLFFVGGGVYGTEVAAGGRVAFVVENGAAKPLEATLRDPASLQDKLVGSLDALSILPFMQWTGLRKEMAGIAEKAGITSDDDVVALVKEICKVRAKSYGNAD